MGATQSFDSQLGVGSPRRVASTAVSVGTPVLALSVVVLACRVGTLTRIMRVTIVLGEGFVRAYQHALREFISVGDGQWSRKGRMETGVPAKLWERVLCL